MMRILGISPLDKDATAAIYADGKLSVIAEERLSRTKLQDGFPEKAILELFHQNRINAQDIDLVVYPFMQWWVEGSRIARGYLKDLPCNWLASSSRSSKIPHLWAYTDWCRRAIHEHRKYHGELNKGLKKLGIRCPLQRVEHHEAHTAGAYLTSGFQQALAITLDWYGGGLAGSVSTCTPYGIESQHQFPYPHSLGLFYAQATSALGFQPSRHEGKIVGLAAFGNPAELHSILSKRFVCENGDYRYMNGMDFTFSRQLAKNHSKEDVAAGYQNILEEIVEEVTQFWTSATGFKKVVLSGGVTANVKMNQRIAELEGVEEVFIHPNMGDGGTGLGAIYAALFERKLIESKTWESCFLGNQFSEFDLKKSLLDAGLEILNMENSYKTIAKLLAEGNIIARFDGAMEYGPRALGNRSIIAAATQPEINAVLNQKLGRTEFMPFAPATLFEHCEDRYKNIHKHLLPTRFMTMTCVCTELMKKESPAVVHVDGTARPQILRRRDNPAFYDILKAYFDLTGIPSMINTSFNRHEEPIVNSPEEAIASFLGAKLDYLSMGPFLAKAKT